MLIENRNIRPRSPLKQRVMAAMWAPDINNKGTYLMNLCDTSMFFGSSASSSLSFVISSFSSTMS